MGRANRRHAHHGGRHGQKDDPSAAKYEEMAKKMAKSMKGKKEGEKKEEKEEKEQHPKKNSLCVGSPIPGLKGEGYGTVGGVFAPNNNEIFYFQPYESDPNIVVHYTKRVDEETGAVNWQRGKKNIKYPEMLKYVTYVEGTIPYGPNHHLLTSWDNLFLIKTENNEPKTAGGGDAEEKAGAAATFKFRKKFNVPINGANRRLFMAPKVDDMRVCTDKMQIIDLSADVDDPEIKLAEVTKKDLPCPIKGDLSSNGPGDGCMLADGSFIASIEDDDYDERTHFVVVWDAKGQLKHVQEMEVGVFFPVPDGRCLAAFWDEKKYVEIDTKMFPLKFGKTHHFEKMKYPDGLAWMPNGNALWTKHYSGAAAIEVHDLGVTPEHMAPYYAPRKGKEATAMLLPGKEAIVSGNHDMEALPDFAAIKDAKILRTGFAAQLPKLVKVHLTNLANVTNIQDTCLEMCASLQEVILDLPHLTTIGADFCHECPKLKLVELANVPALKSIGPGFCEGCVALEEFTLPALAYLESIASSFLHKCAHLKKFDASAACPQVKLLDAPFLGSCSDLTEVNVSGFTCKDLRVPPKGRVAPDCLSIKTRVFVGGAADGEKGAIKRIGSKFVSKFQPGLYAKPDGGGTRYRFLRDGRYEYSWANCGFQGGQGTSETGTWSNTDASTLELHVTETTSWVDYDGYDVDTTAKDETPKVKVLDGNSISFDGVTLNLKDAY